MLTQCALHLLDLGERLLVAAPHVRQVGHRGKCGFETGWWQTPRTLRFIWRSYSLGCPDAN
jgi:hypothetical protein